MLAHLHHLAAPADAPAATTGCARTVLIYSDATDRAYARAACGYLAQPELLFHDFLWTNSSSAILAETTLQVAPLVKERRMAAWSVLRDQTA